MGTDMDKTRPLVLAVDDIETNLMILEEIMKDDYNVITAHNGVEALKVLENTENLPKIIREKLRRHCISGNFSPLFLP